MANQVNSKQVVHTFTGGMNKDLDYTLRQPNTYYEAENFRLYPTAGMDSQVLKNIKDVSPQTVTITAGMIIIGHCVIRDYLVLFTTNDSTGDNHIYRTVINEDGTIDNSQTVLLYDDTLSEDYTFGLGFSIDYRVKAIGRYENDNLIKVYWTDTQNITRFANIADYITVNGGAYNITTNKYKAVDKLEFLPDAILNPIELYNIVSGSLTSGSIQYSYQFFNKNETESSYASLSGLIPITSSSYTNSGNGYFHGDIPETNCGIGFTLRFNNTNTGFNSVRLVAVHYETLDGTPTIRIADEKEINPAGGYVYLTDTGESLFELTLEEFSIIANNIFICGDLEEKDNILFASNITEEYFDIGDWDARAYRFAGSSSTSTNFNYQDTSIPGTGGIAGSSLRNYSILYGADGDYYVGYGPANPWYYFNSSGIYTTSGDAANASLIPSTFDCINKYTDISLDTVSRANRFMYTSDGARIGGSGVNVSYVFDLDQVYLTGTTTSSIPTALLNVLGSGLDPLNRSYTDYTSPFISSKYKGFMRDETYRFGIVFFDAKGRSSFVRWIGDIRMPSQADGDSVPTYNNGSAKYTFDATYKDSATGYVYANILTPVFTVSNPPTGAVAYKIVYVKRTEDDKSVVSQGILLPTENNASILYPYEYSNTLAASGTNLVRFASPENGFKGSTRFKSNDFCQVVNRTPPANVTSTTLYTNLLTHRLGETSPILNSSGAVGNFNILGANHVFTLNDGKLYGQDKIDVDVFGYTYNGYNSFSATDFYGGTSLVGHTYDVTLSHPYSDPTYKYVVNYKRNVYGSQYGGNLYSDRSLNQYISASDYTLTGSTAKCKYGDTYISFFSYHSLLMDLSKSAATTNTYAEIIVFPVETEINISHATLPSFANYVLKTIPEYKMVQEGANDSWTDLAGTVFNQPYNLYDYNYVYSQLNIINNYYPEPLGFENVQTYDTRIKNSQTKTNNESVDSWTKFSTNDYIEVDGRYGPINNIVKYNNKLFYFQDNGFGVASVNQRSLISDTNPGSLVLGTGGILDRYDYVSELVGNKNRFGISTTGSGIYWIDNNKKEVYRFGSSLEPLGYIKGIKSHLDKYNVINNVVTGVDPENNEVLFTIEGYVTGYVESVVPASGYSNSYVTFNNLDIFRDKAISFFCSLDTPFKIIVGTSTSATIEYPNTLNVETTTAGAPTVHTNVDVHFRDTLMFNEYSNVFSSFSTIIPFTYIKGSNKLLSTYGNYVTAIGLHNAGTTLDCRLSIINSDNPAYTKVFDNVLMRTSCIGSTGIDQQDSSFTHVRCLTSYQNTDWQNLVLKSTMEKRDRHFSFAIPRNRVSVDVRDNIYNILDPANLSETTLFKDRIRDKYCRIDFKHLSYNDEEFSVSYIISKYRISYR